MQSGEAQFSGGNETAMTAYAAPIEDMRFVLHRVIGLDGLLGADGFDADLIDQVLEEAGRLAGSAIAPLNRINDTQGVVLENGVVRTPEPVKQAYRDYVDGGWNAVPFEEEYGGQGMPWAVASAIQEMWQSASMSFGLCPLLNQGAVEALQAHGSPEQKAMYLPNLISGEWTGTMNLTEPQAGSDLSDVRTKAVPENGHYRISGQKIYISWGEHDLTDNIIHLVLARTPDAPAGVKGISLFIVPKVLVNEDGSLGRRNDLRCVSVEHKLGIHGSPTAVMAYGEVDGAIGYLVGEEGRGLSYMFTMMNNARLSVGLQGVAIAERAYQQALDYAKTRVQGRGLNGSDEPVAIIEHPDVRRMLMTMKSLTEAGRALTYEAMANLDRGRMSPDPTAAAAAQARVDLLTPVVKSWCTDNGVEVASLGVQIHGGMGYVEETGAAQHLRDARILPIYEGTNGIQANDLVFRKVVRDDGAAVDAYLEEVDEIVAALSARPGDDAQVIARALAGAAEHLHEGTRWLLEVAPKDAAAAAAASSPYLKLFGVTAGGAMMARAALAALDEMMSPAADHDRLESKLVTARFFAEQVMATAPASLAQVRAGSSAITTLSVAQL